MAVRESVEAAAVRWQLLGVLQQHYSNFVPFLRDCMTFLGFSTTEIQEDIAQFLEFGPHYIMVQAQRSQAKTTITACYAVWDLIHNPKHRVLVISAGGTQANEISTLITKLILNMPQLECMRPDRNMGDRTSVEAFDLHYTLKGVDKSPSVACVGITGNLAGKRADLLIADDIESKKNSQTAGQRQLLIDRSKEFTDLCSSGRIIYLGTPQSMESVYNGLPSRGFTVRIWTGRYPTPKQLPHYDGMLAPILLRRIEANPALQTGGGLDGTQGQAVDPKLQNEENLQKKERDKGPADFQLQYMLNTKLLDGQRYPLRPERILVMSLTGRKRLPIEVTPGFGEKYLRPYQSAHFPFHLSVPHSLSEETDQLKGVCMYVDPAGGGRNGDETGYAVVGFLNGNLYVLDIGGLPGGYAVEVMTALAEKAKQWAVNVVVIEKNMGYGAFREVWLPILRGIHTCGVEDDYVTGQKELRIIETLEPIIERGSLILNSDIVEQDNQSVMHYPVAHQQQYSFFFQLARITRGRGALIHDDRLDALEGACRYWVKSLQINQEEETKRLREAEKMKWFANPFGRPMPQSPAKGSILSRRKR